MPFNAIHLIQSYIARKVHFLRSTYYKEYLTVATNRFTAFKTPQPAAFVFVSRFVLISNPSENLVQ